MIADLQPLIKFELHPHEIEDPIFWQKDQQQTPKSFQDALHETSPVKQPNTSRRRTLRPSLGPIPEESGAASSIPFLTPNAKSSRVYTSPFKQRSAAADRLRTPTKIAGSPMSKFTLAATPEAGQFEITNEQGHFRVPSPTNTQTTAGLSDPRLDNHGHYSVQSSAATDSPVRRGAVIETTTHGTAPEDIFYTSIPIFDQPADQMQAEPEHESRRRISLNNARRSDRRSDTKVLKRARTWIASTYTPNRRHSDAAQIVAESRGNNRRHTLDVDVARNPDIFAQNLPEAETQVPQKQSIEAMAQNAQRTEKSTFDTKFEEFQQKMTKRKASSMNKVDLSAEIDEEVVKLYLDPESTTKFESEKSPQPLQQSPNKYTPGKEIPWDDFKLFAGVKILSPTKNTSEMISAKDAETVDAMVSGTTVPNTMNITVDDQETAGSPMAEDEEEGGEDDLLNEATNTGLDISIDISGISEESDGIRIEEPTVNVLDDRPFEHVNETSMDIPAETDEVTTMEEDRETADDDSALALLHSFVRRAQNSKEGKQSITQDTVPILASTAAKKRLSGSISSATSDTGSPMARVEASTNTPSPRKPLEARDANKSPSPKKRKLGETEDAPLFKKSGRLVRPDLEDMEPSQPKKRRKKMESDTDDIFNPEMDLGQVLTQKSRGSSGIARRSSRIATTKSSKIDNASQPGFSTIPVRLPGSSGMLQDPDMPAVSTSGITSAVLQRKIEKDLATETRNNTRRNKGGSVPVPVALVALAQQPAGESPAFGISACNKTRPGGNKTVRWDVILTRVQGEEEPVVVTVASPVEEQQETVVDSGNDQKAEEDEDETFPSPPQMRHVGLTSKSNNRPGNPTPGQPHEQVAAPPPEPEKKTPPRRSTRSATTASRLPRSAAGPAATPKKSPLPAPPSQVAKKVGRPAGSGGASSVAGRLGTPAPKRRGARR